MGRSLSGNGVDRRGWQGQQAFEMFRFKCWLERFECSTTLIVAAHSPFCCIARKHSPWVPRWKQLKSATLRPVNSAARIATFGAMIVPNVVGRSPLCPQRSQLTSQPLNPQEKQRGCPGQRVSPENLLRCYYTAAKVMSAC